MTDRESQLTNQELMHVALDASRNGNMRECIEALRQILVRDDTDAMALYMLGAVHAQIGMGDQAVNEMTRAVELDPGLTAAHFQLGLLHYTADRYEEAEKAWRPIDENVAIKCLYLFKMGLLALAEGRYEDAIRSLESGIEANDYNEPLSEDMRRIVDSIRSQMGELSVSGATDENEAALRIAQRSKRSSSLSAYRNESERGEREE